MGNAFFTAWMSISINFPVADETITEFFSSALGTNSFPFSSEQNKAMLQKDQKQSATVREAAKLVW